jgi:hypothetical protein
MVKALIPVWHAASLSRRTASVLACYHVGIPTALNANDVTVPLAFLPSRRKRHQARKVKLGLPYGVQRLWWTNSFTNVGTVLAQQC